MTTPEIIDDTAPRSWSNLSLVLLYIFSLLAFPAAFIIGFIGMPNPISLLLALWLLWMIFELAAQTYIVVRYNTGTLSFMRPLKKYSIMKSKERNYEMIVEPGEWTELHWKTYKDGTTLYFANEETGLYYCRLKGIPRFSNDLPLIFDDRLLKPMEENPEILKSELKREKPKGVF